MNIGTVLIKLEGYDRKFLEAWGVRYRINWRPTFYRRLSERWRVDQPSALAELGARRTRFSRGQATVGLR
jgi:hypothetical protein